MLTTAICLSCGPAVQACLGSSGAPLVPFPKHSTNMRGHCRNNLRIRPAYFCFSPEAEELVRERVFEGMQVIEGPSAVVASYRIREVNKRTCQQEMCQLSDESVVAPLTFHSRSYRSLGIRTLVEREFNPLHGSCGVCRGACQEVPA